MKHRYASDCHTHSDCSFDGEAPMEAMCGAALKKGLYCYTVSDHCECNKWEQAPRHETGYRAVAEKAWKQMEECRERFPELRFLKGVELGQPTQDPGAAAEALRGRDYDFVIGSLHNLAGEKDFYYAGKDGMAPERWEEFFSRYFRELLEMIRWGRFDSLAHITYPLRYGPRSVTFEKHREGLEAVLSALAKSDRALELNTSRLLTPGYEYIPDLAILKLYRSLGGRLVTLGSDAHGTDRVGDGIDEAMEMLKEAGFTEFAVFVKRQPVLLPLE